METLLYKPQNPIQLHWCFISGLQRTWLHLNSCSEAFATFRGETANRQDREEIHLFQDATCGLGSVNDNKFHQSSIWSSLRCSVQYRRTVPETQMRLILLSLNTSYQLKRLCKTQVALFVNWKI